MSFEGATITLRHREFRIFWIAALISNTGGWMQNAAIPYAVFQLAHRDSRVGVAGFLTYFPYLLAGLLGGSLADSFDRKRLLVVAQIGQAAFAAALWLLVAEGWETTGRLSALAFGAGLTAGLNVPAWQAFVSQLVPRELMVNAVTLNSTQFNAARALGTFLAGIVLSVWGAGAVFAINAISFGSVLIALVMIREYRRHEPKRWRPIEDLVAGFRYVRATPAIISCCIAIAAVAGIASPLFTFLPASYGQVIFAVRGWHLALLLGAGGIGTVLLSPFILTTGARASRRGLLVLAMTAHGVATALVGLAPNPYVAVVGLALYGGSYLAIASALNTTIQLIAREDMRGKIFAIYVGCLTGALPIGLLVWGWASSSIGRTGIRAVSVGAGTLLIVVTALLALSGRFTALEAADDFATSSGSVVRETR